MLSDPAKAFLDILRRIERESKSRAREIDQQIIADSIKQNAEATQAILDANAFHIRRAEIRLAVNNARSAIDWRYYQ